MAVWIHAFSILNCIILLSKAEVFKLFTSDNELNHLAVDHSTGTVYVGAVNHLYQLNENLSLLVNVTTGPKLDKHVCTPPIDANQCPNAVMTDNYNKLLLLDIPKNRIVVCGSIFKGICSLRSMVDISSIQSYDDTRGEKSFVASIYEKITTVGLVTDMSSLGPRVLFVGKGNGQYDNGIIISTRILDQQGDKDPFETYMDSATFKQAAISTNFQHFVTAFEDENFVYFVSTQADKNSNGNRTLITRLCKNDSNYFSYIEMDLQCKDKDGISFNICRSAFITEPGEKLASHIFTSSENGKVLFGVYSKDVPNQETTALCMFSLRDINKKFEENRDACYTSKTDNVFKDGKKIFYKPYGAEIKCGGSSLSNPASKYPCGDEHLPYPLESRDGVVAEPVLVRKTNPYTSVAISVVNEHTVAFLGTAEGKLVKAFLGEQSSEYKTIHLDSHSAVKDGLAFDASREHIYAMNKEKIYKVPVQKCHQYSDCNQCIQAKDPYCGWCVLDGKCTTKGDCMSAGEPNHWLWSRDGVCIKVESANPQNMSVMAPGKVVLTVNPPVTLKDDDHLMCTFGDKVDHAELHEDGTISCPPPDNIPETEKGKDNVNVTINLHFEKRETVFFANYSYPFYNCKQAMYLSENLPCSSCVNSQWKCQWAPDKHTCSDFNLDTVNEGTITREEDCPQFFDPEPSIIPMEHKTTIKFKGKNLEHFQGEAFNAGYNRTDFEAAVSEESGDFSLAIPEIAAQNKDNVPLNIYIKVKDRNIDSKLNVNLYNCFYGRSDCSLCLAANDTYECVWCNNKCVYKEKCTGTPTSECPAPVITDFEPKTAPLLGGIRLTIKGSNLGVIDTDVEEIKVANTPCEFVKEEYSVSTRVVCTVGACIDGSTSGNIEIKVKEKLGSSPEGLMFVYQDPGPNTVTPAEGILAGGTNITITGEHLKTGSMSDIKVMVGDIPCTVIEFGESIVCSTGQAAKDGEVIVTLQYGTQTKKEAGKFFYKPNPVIMHFSPDKSFVSGGRNITVSGTGFNLVQSLSMIATFPNGREERHTSEQDPRYSEDVLERVNDSLLIFSTPKVPENIQNSEVLTVIKMDGYETPLQTRDLNFGYVSDPTFENFTDGIKKQVNNLINAKGTNLNAAMSIQEAKAFVGEGPCKISTLTNTDLYCVPPDEQPLPRRRHKRDTSNSLPEFIVKFGNREWVLGKVEYGQSAAFPLNIIIPVVLIPMILIIAISIYCYRRKSQQAEREYEKVKLQLEGLEESVRERCKKEFTDLMIEMEDHTSDLNEVGIPVLDYKTYTDRVFFLPSSNYGENDVMITGRLDIPESRKQTVEQALNQFSNLLNSKSFLISFIHTLEAQKDFSAREKLYFASLLTVALHGKLEYYTDIMRTLFLELMEQYVAKNPKLMLRRSETVVERMLSNWMSICLYQYLKDTAGEPLYKLFKAIKHQVEKGPVDAVQIKAKYTLNDTGLLGDDVEYTQLTVNVIVQGDDAEPVPVKVLNCDTITQVKEKIVDQVYKNINFSQRPKASSLALEWRPGSTAQILSDLDLTSQKEGRWRRVNTLMHYNVRDNATLILSKIGISQQQEENHHDFPGERHALLEDENKTWHLVRPADEVDEGKSKRGSMKEKERTKAITEIYLTRLLSVKGTLQQFVDNFFLAVLNSNQVVPPAIKYFFDFLDEQAEKYEIKDEDTVHIWKTNSLSLRFWVNILKNPHFIFDVHVHQVVDASLSVIAQTFMDACSRTEHKLSRESPSNKLLYAKEISTYKKMVEDYYKGIRQMVSVSDQDMNTHLAEISRAHTDSLNTLVALHQLYQYTNKYYDAIINALEEDPGAQRMQLACRLQQIAAALENKITDL
ncbi:plexin-B2 [Pelobates fuscus]|uniref:plexin-B2 n=1 Tax=Pelobates fuscus TaxID=191477 RepID=UPI002FE448D8